jgi:hypothetical protein
MPGQTLEQLEERPWGTPDFDSGLVSTCHRLWTKPVSEFTVADLQIMIGQGIGLTHLVPRALQILEKDALAESDYYAGDLLTSVIHADSRLPGMRRLGRARAAGEPRLRSSVAGQRLRPRRGPLSRVLSDESRPLPLLRAPH